MWINETARLEHMKKKGDSDTQIEPAAARIGQSVFRAINPKSENRSFALLFYIYIAMCNVSSSSPASQSC